MTTMELRLGVVYLVEVVPEDLHSALKEIVAKGRVCTPMSHGTDRYIMMTMEGVGNEQPLGVLVHANDLKGVVFVAVSTLAHQKAMQDRHSVKTNYKEPKQHTGGFY